MDFAKITELSKKYEPQMTRFLRDMIAIPSESCQEEAVVKRIKQEMEAVGFDRVEIDKMGNVIGYMEEAFAGADIVYPKSWAPFAAMCTRLSARGE